MRQRSLLVPASILLAALFLAPFNAAPQEAKYQALEARQISRISRIDSRGQFRANWKSLGQYSVPSWFRDAKFGIFIHWGVYSVPAFQNEWYSRNMYQQGSAAYRHQVATYGPESSFGYKDFIPMFRGQNFNAARWVDLFARAGAKYIVPVAEHCDGFAMYDSDFTPWDAAKMGPKRDVIGELARAAHARGLRFGVSSHRAEHWWWYDGGMRFDSDVRDPKYAGLYGPAQPETMPGITSTKEPDPDHLERWRPPNPTFLRDWLARSTELVDKYHPDFFYFDWWNGQPAFQPYLQQFAAYYYNRAAQRHQGVVLTYKNHAMPENTAVLDVERGKLNTLRLLPWQTDTSVSVKSWGYARGDTYRDSASLIRELVDIVSKNGNLLLNVGPEADGTIPPQAKAVLLQIGDWLRVNGEAIYGTRPWLVYGEGPTMVDCSCGRKGTDTESFAPQDIRYTMRGRNLYAIALGKPESGNLLLRSLMKDSPYLHGPVTSVTLLGSSQLVEWQQGADGLILNFPAGAPDEPAYAFRIQTRFSSAP